MFKPLCYLILVTVVAQADPVTEEAKMIMTATDAFNNDVPINNHEIMKITGNDFVNLKCVVSTNGLENNHPQYTWYFNRKISTRHLLRDSYLVLAQTVENSGEYICEDNNTMKAEWVNITLWSVPIVGSMQNEEIIAKPGESKEIPCGIDGDNLSFNWTFNGNLISGANKMTFTIENVTAEDDGIYVCDAELCDYNTCKTASRTIFLRVPREPKYTIKSIVLPVKVDDQFNRTQFTLDECSKNMSAIPLPKVFLSLKSDCMDEYVNKDREHMETIMNEFFKADFAIYCCAQNDMGMDMKKITFKEKESINVLPKGVLTGGVLEDTTKSGAPIVALSAFVPLMWILFV